MAFDLTGAEAKSPRPPSVWSAGEAAGHIGERGTVCGIVASARHVDSPTGGPTFLNLDRPHPNQTFTVFIQAGDRERFDRPEVRYARKRICITGTIATHDGKPEIVVHDPSQIALAE